MPYSKVVSVKVMSPNMNKNRAYKVTRITPHCMVGQLFARKCGDLFARSSYQASSNYGIGTNGEVGLYVDEADRSWCSSSADNDNRAITIECASDTRSPYAMNNKVWKALVDLCVDICKRYGKTTLIWFGDRATSLAYKPKDTEMILTAHRWFAQKSCPGDWLYSRLGKLAEAVNSKLTEEPAKTVEEKPNTEAASLITNEEADRERIIWDYLSGKGLNAYAVAGIMGNLYAESALRPNNLQNSFERKLGMTDKGYTTAVNDGTYKNFAKDGAGYGLAQWTWHTRKAALLSFAKNRGKSIDDLNMQMDFLWQELQGYARSMAALKAGKSIRAVSDVILTDFEKPADQGDSVKAYRADLGREIYDRQTGAVEETSGKYALQYGAYGAKDNANKMVKRLQEQGIEAEVVKIGSLYKVRGSEFKTAAEASKACQASSAKAVVVEV